jgi:Protein of unknown function (DUF1579)
MATETQQQTPMQAAPEKEHKWLQRLVGEWTLEGEAQGSDQQVQKDTGKETVRTLGELWIVAEGEGTMPDGSPARMMMTLGYDPQKKRFVGTWVGSMMTNLWVYDGTLSGDTLTLHCVGPAFDDPSKTANYQDIIEMKSDRQRIHTSRVQGSDGSWTEFMRSTYRRK